jgi:hypothetical protein
VPLLMVPLLMVPLLMVPLLMVRLSMVRLGAVPLPRLLATRVRTSPWIRMRCWIGCWLLRCGRCRSR